MISSLTEHTRKCLKIEYLGRIEYHFQKSRVTGSWDHKDSVSAKKVFKKNSCLCTFKKISIHQLGNTYDLNSDFCIFLVVLFSYVNSHSSQCSAKSPPEENRTGDQPYSSRRADQWAIRNPSWATPHPKQPQWCFLVRSTVYVITSTFYIYMSID